VALSHVIRQSERVFLLFVFDTNILNKLKDKDDRRVSFIVNCLRELEKSIESKQSSLIVRYGDPVKEIYKIIKELKVDAIFINRDYEPRAKDRDGRV
jgi:deoxyribodipyrimidine photo-lyase